MLRQDLSDNLRFKSWIFNAKSVKFGPIDPKLSKNFLGLELAHAFEFFFNSFDVAIVLDEFSLNLQKWDIWVFGMKFVDLGLIHDG